MLSAWHFLWQISEMWRLLPFEVRERLFRCLSSQTSLSKRLSRNWDKISTLKLLPFPLEDVDTKVDYLWSSEANKSRSTSDYKFDKHLWLDENKEAIKNTVRDEMFLWVIFIVVALHTRKQAWVPGRDFTAWQDMKELSVLDAQNFYLLS